MDNVEEEISFLNDNHEVVAKWVFKNVIMLNSASNYRQLVPASHYLSLYNGEIPKGVTIDLSLIHIWWLPLKRYTVPERF